MPTILLKSGSIITALTLIAGLGTVASGLPAPYSGYLMFAVTFAGLLLKAFNPADSKIEE